MPKQKKYLEGFKLHPGMVLMGWRLEQIKVDHQAITRYKKYRYPMMMLWKKDEHPADPLIFQKHLNDYLSPRTIKSEAGNDYYCTIVDLHYLFDKHDFAHVTGYGVCEKSQ